MNYYIIMHQLHLAEDNENQKISTYVKLYLKKENIHKHSTIVNFSAV